MMHSAAGFGISADRIANSAFSWALWRVLDWVSARYLPGGMLPATRPAAPPGDPNAVAQAALSSVNAEELKQALASLRDENSPLTQALASLLGTPQLTTQERKERFEQLLAGLNRGETAALLTVLLYSVQQGQL